MANNGMDRVKKGKRATRTVLYLRVTSAEHAKLSKKAAKRGYPHTIASIAAEIISQHLANEALSKEDRS
jgi:hypothetical protein